MPFPGVRVSCLIAIFVSVVWGRNTDAAELGPVVVQSALGQALRLSVPLVGASGIETGSRCISAKIASLDGRTVLVPRIELIRSPGTASILVRSSLGINEPVLNVTIAIGCGMSLQRDYQILLDPARHPAAVPASAPAALPAALALKRAPIALPRSHSWRRTPIQQQPSAARWGHRANPGDQTQIRTRAKVAPSVHRILRLSAPTKLTEFRKIALTLRISDHLAALPARPVSAPTGQPGIERPAALPAAVISARDQQLEAQAQQLLRDLQAEAASLRAETARIEHQRASYHGPLASSHNNDALNWIKALGVLLAACLAALGWLLWRIMAMKRGAARPWHEMFAGHDGDTIDAALLGSNTEFGTTGFNLSEIHTEDFSTTVAAPLADTTAALPARPTPPASAPVPHDSAPSVQQSTMTHAAELEAASRPAATAGDPADQSTAAYAPAIKAEEVADVMELVEAWMALNAPDKVLELLKPFGDIAQPESPLPWLCLLDVYRELGDQEKYEAILERIKTIFNVKLAPWMPLPYVEQPKALADFPHVVDEIAGRWHSKELVPYLKSLLVDDREGTRHGFDLSAYRDILQLTAIAGKTVRLPQDEAMPESARRILFRSAAEEPVPRHTQQQQQHRSADGGPAADAVPPVRIRERPKHPTPSHEPASAIDKGRLVDPVSADLHRPIAAAHAVLRATLPASDSRDPPDAGRQIASGPSAPDATASTQARGADDMTPMAIKLHLAMAYQDIGDKEGACMLLDEVIHEGTSEQSEQARRMRTKLA